MGRVARVVPTLLLHVNLLLTLFAGAMLMTAARLKWDPSAYIAARELFPLEYRSAAAALPALGGMLALLAHLALTALRCSRHALRRALFISYFLVLFTLYAARSRVGRGTWELSVKTLLSLYSAKFWRELYSYYMQYGALMLVLVWSELAWGGWVSWRVRRWLRGGEAQELRHALALSDHLHPLLQHLAHYHPLPERVNQLMQEAEADLPRNVHVMAWASGALVALQLAAAALALCSGCAARRPSARKGTLEHSTITTTTPLSSRRGDGEGAPLRAVYKQGRLVMV